MKQDHYDKSMRANIYSSIYRLKILSLCILAVLTAVLAYVFSIDKQRSHEISDGPTPVFLILVAACIVLFAISIFVDIYILHQTASIGRRLNKMAYIDKLTGLPNRYSCDLLIESFNDPDKLANAGFILMQIKNLMSVNADTGHANGNWLISEFCSILEEVAEEYGYVGRNGGNEFILLIENCDSTSADLFLLELTKRIHGYNEMNVGTPMEIAYARVLNSDENKEKISDLISLGYRKLREMPQTLS
jgi:diguanylate cyclase (GGDEF)-like protein